MKTVQNRVTLETKVDLFLGVLGAKMARFYLDFDTDFGNSLSTAVI
jgi:hypothetical protein